MNAKVKVSCGLTILAIGAAALLHAPGHTATILGPDGEFSSFIGNLEWKPSYSCSKPRKPYEWDEYSRDSYIRQGKLYLDCIKRQADNDAEYAVEIVYEGHQKAVDDFLNEVRRGY